MLPTIFRYRVSPTITIKSFSTLVDHGFSIQTMTKVEDLHIATARSDFGRSRPQLGNLPPGTVATYTKIIVPTACQTAASLNPWEAVCNPECETIWNVVLGEKHPVVQGTEFFKVLRGLIDQSVASFRHRLAEASLKALEKDYDRQSLVTADERRAHVEYLLGTGEKYDYLSKDHRFLWESSDGTEQTNERKDLFRSFLIAYTFAEHLACISTIPEDLLLEATCRRHWSIDDVHIRRSSRIAAKLDRVSRHSPGKGGQFESCAHPC
ncbi:hypothetical protein CPC08DRAFT_717021 [Agrocybe pediades]|nr:hypothetical protein CPC08DRAFT_717021 [Agrocybe pediades]